MGTSILNSGLLKNIENYEIEIELINENLIENDIPKLLVEQNNLIVNIYNIIHSTTMLVTKNLLFNVISQYLQLMYKYKIDSIESFKKHTDYFGAKNKPQSLMKHNIIDDNKLSILNPYAYTITDKADGITTLLFIDSNSMGYLITKSFEIIPLNIKTILRNCVVEGEYTQLINKKFNLLLYEIYFYDNKAVYNNYFHSIPPVDGKKSKKISHKETLVDDLEGGGGGGGDENGEDEIIINKKKHTETKKSKSVNKEK
jgi:hypothetical protein